VQRKVEGLSNEEIRDYEKRHENRKRLVESLGRKI
jgi:hypothetical protein